MLQALYWLLDPWLVAFVFAVVMVLLLATLVGAVVGVALMVAAKHGRNVPIPFGPYLAGGGLIALFWGQALTQSYLQLLAAP